MAGNGYARNVLYSLGNTIKMFLRNLIRSHNCYIRIGVDLLLRCTARSNDHLI